MLVSSSSSRPCQSVVVGRSPQPATSWPFGPPPKELHFYENTWTFAMIGCHMRDIQMKKLLSWLLQHTRGCRRSQITYSSTSFQEHHSTRYSLRLPMTCWNCWAKCCSWIHSADAQPHRWVEEASPRQRTCWNFSCNKCSDLIPRRPVLFFCFFCNDTWPLHAHVLPEIQKEVMCIDLEDNMDKNCQAFVFMLMKFSVIVIYLQALQMPYFSNKPPPTPGHLLPRPGAAAPVLKEPELKPSLKRKLNDSEVGECAFL